MKGHRFIDDVLDMEDIVSVCGGSPRGDELPQVGGVEDIVLDVYSDAINAPRECVAGWIHHQYVDEDAMIH